jgi:hypothetical protein
MKKPFTLTPKAEELIAKMEAREAAKKKAAERGAVAPVEQADTFVTLGPNPLDFLGKVGSGK